MRVRKRCVNSHVAVQAMSLNDSRKYFQSIHFVSAHASHPSQKSMTGRPAISGRIPRCGNRVPNTRYCPSYPRPAYMPPKIVGRIGRFCPLSLLSKNHDLHDMVNHTYHVIYIVPGYPCFNQPKHTQPTPFFHYIYHSPSLTVSTINSY